MDWPPTGKNKYTSKFTAESGQTGGEKKYFRKTSFRQLESDERVQWKMLIRWKVSSAVTKKLNAELGRPLWCRKKISQLVKIEMWRTTGLRNSLRGPSGALGVSTLCNRVSKKPGAGVELCVVCGCAECAGEYGGAGAGLPVRGL